MIERASIERLLIALPDADPREVKDGLIAALKLALVQKNSLAVFPESTSFADKIRRFFEIAIEVEPLAAPYSITEVSGFARSSEQATRNKAEREVDSGMSEFYRSIADDYGRIASAAEYGDWYVVIRRFEKLDTADRDNFGWGAEGWDEQRWVATLDWIDREET